jgi:hypothetical protein
MEDKTNEELKRELKRDWFSFFQKDWFQAAIFFVAMFLVLYVFGAIETPFFERVMLAILGFVFADDTLSSFGRK